MPVADTARLLATVALMPPTPFLVLAAWGAWRARRQRRGGLALVGTALAGLWLSQCDATADGLSAVLVPTPPALSAADVTHLAARARAGEPIAIVVLGGGVEATAEDPGSAQPEVHAMARLRYALGLARATGLPLAASGGVGTAQAGAVAVPEAAVDARIARDEFGQTLRWLEDRSTNTRENAAFTLPMLARDGIRDVWVVTHGWHMRRAMRDFERAAAALPAPRIVVHAAPMGLAVTRQVAWLRWCPSADGAWRVRVAWREWLGWVAGA